MKIKKLISKILIITLIVSIGLKTTALATVKDYSGDKAKTLHLDYYRHVKGEKKEAYALSTSGSNYKPIFQIMNSNTTNYYCLNATQGASWIDGHIGVDTTATYNRTYDLEKDIDVLAHDTNKVYSNLAKSQYLKQILWILDNIYIPDTSASITDSERLAKKQELLAKAGIIYGIVEGNEGGGLNGEDIEEEVYSYKYEAQEGYDYTEKLAGLNYDARYTLNGWYYNDKQRVHHYVELPDEMVEVAQQAAIWYYTNHLENNADNNSIYDVKTQGLKLARTNGNTASSPTWYEMGANDDGIPYNKTETDISGMLATVEKWQQEQATILCWYLIDAADNYAKATNNISGSPLKINNTTNIVEKGNNYVVGPIKIEQQKESVYSLENIITVNGDKNTGAYISNAEGTKQSNQTVSSYIGKNFYVTIPKSKINTNNVKIEFDGTYKTNSKTLWVSTTATEQPIVEVMPKDEPINLPVTAEIEEQKEFDLALRKVITKITDKNGKEKLITNEEDKLATRNVTTVASDIETKGTATYKHRKDPVVVEKGDIITYSITVYNEGDMPGYAETIIDRLPAGIVPKAYAENKTTSGSVTGITLVPVPDGQDGGAIAAEYNYTYNKDKNEITLTNKGKYSLPEYGKVTKESLSEERVDIECVVTGEPTTNNKYLTNIAYISKAFNTETNKEVVEDRDSRTDNNPNANLNTDGDKYTGYHGGNNHNGDNNKDVYKDGTNNDDYFPGREDDDDFEVVVLKPAEFDLALQKYINGILSKDGSSTVPGRNEPTINTKELAEKTEKTATYTQDKNPIKVKQGEYVVYKFTVYNEGEIDGYVNKITDNIPQGLQFVYAKDNDGKTVIICDSEGNMEEMEVSESLYENITKTNSFWTIDANGNSLKKDTYNGESTVSVTCDVKSYLGQNYKLLNAYDKSKDNNYDGQGLDRVTVSLMLRVNTNLTGKTIRNEAAITEATDKDGNVQDATGSAVKDRDSKTTDWKGKDGEKNYEDDEDYDRIIIPKVDLALTKFITAVSDDINIEDGEYLSQDKTEKNAGTTLNPYIRATKVDTTKLRDDDTCHDATYTQVKTPLTINDGSYVLYNIRVYNEGDVDVYAGEVTDYLPNYLDFVECDRNTDYKWKVESDGKTIRTSYLSEANGTDNKLIAFNKATDDGKGSGLHYKDIAVLCRINSNAPESTRLVNSAAITKYEDENGSEIDKDIDSEPEDLPDEDKNKEKRNQDDDDYEVVIIKKRRVDLALTKFITAVSDDINIEDGEYLTKDKTSKNAGSESNPYTRATKVDTSKLRDDENCHDATYTQVKTPLTISDGSYVLYNIRVYNEGEVDVYAGKVTDYLPEYLEFVQGEYNAKYNWTNPTNDGRTIETTYLSKTSGADNKLIAFNKATDDGKGSGLHYKDIAVLCRINSNAPESSRLVNSAAITKYEDENGSEIDKDVDSEPEDLPDEDKNKEKRNQDDDDYEVVIIKKKRVDLALTKFITAVSTDINIEDGEYLTKDKTSKNAGSESNPYTRATKVDTSKLRDDENCHDATYTRVKDPLTVPAKSYVLYNIRVYNEGETDVYAGEVTDKLPDYLDFVECDRNTDYKWKVESDGKTIKTTYLSKASGEKNKLKAFDKNKDDGKGSGLDYRDVQVLCKVNDKAPSKTNIINVAEITKYEDKDGGKIEKDIDSEPNNVDKKNEDDDDYEVITIKTFDLSLLKFVSDVTVIEDGKETTTETGNTGDPNKDIIPKVEIHRKKINSTIVKFGYKIKVTNEGDIAGYAKEITDYVPEGLKFYEEDNKGWVDRGNNVISTTLLENTLLQPGESAEVYVVFRWINGATNLGLKTNIAEISKDYNEEGVPDRDSTPNNKVNGEDDIDDAAVLLSISTGLVNNIIRYATIGIAMLGILGVGIFAIKKYVL